MKLLLTGMFAQYKLLVLRTPIKSTETLFRDKKVNLIAAILEENRLEAMVTTG